MVYFKSMYDNFQYNTADTHPDKVLLITIKFPDIKEKEALSHLEELRRLADTMEEETTGALVVPLKVPKQKYLVGEGKAQEIQALAEETNADIIIFDDDLTPAQQRNWERLTHLCVIDRREVILEIFAQRASTREAVLQVALARMQYSLPRLTRAWTHLSRQKGGTRGTRGEGETQLEVDKRLVLRKITRLKKELIKIRSHRNTMRKKRKGIPFPTGALVGYTNAGKSSFLNILIGAGTYVEDKLFATLDPLARKITLPGGKEIILTDTVGFIRKLPHNLIDAFKSTLEEAVLADFLIHIVDISDPEFRLQFKITKNVLEDLEASEKPVILVFNKIDLVSDAFLVSGLRNEYPNAVFISSKTGEGIKDFYKAVDGILKETEITETFSIPHDRYDLVALLHRKGHITEQKWKESSIQIQAQVSPQTRSLLYKILEETPL